MLICQLGSVCFVTGVHRTMENAKIRSLRMDSKVWTRALIKARLLFAEINVALLMQCFVSYYKKCKVTPEFAVCLHSYWTGGV